MSTTNSDREIARRARVQAILTAAAVREVLGEAARHRRLPDGSHVVTVGGREFIGATLAEAIDQTRSGKVS